MRFRTTIRLDGKTATGIRVPEEVVEGLGGGKRPPVRVTINGHDYRTTVAPVRGEFKIPVSAEVREKAGVSAGDEVDIDVELDAEPREVAVPPELAEGWSATRTPGGLSTGCPAARNDGSWTR